MTNNQREQQLYLTDKNKSSNETMRPDKDSDSTESPSHFTDLGEKAELADQPVPGSRHLGPGGNN